MAKVWRCGLPSGDKFVLLALADHANDEGGDVFPSVDLIAEKVTGSRRTVQRALGRLRRIGLLHVEREGGGKARTTRYRICLGTLADEACSCPGQPRQPDTVREGETASSEAPYSVTVTPEPSGTVTYEPSARREAPVTQDTGQPLNGPPRAAPGAQRAAGHLKARLRERGAETFARDWHLRAAAVAATMIGEGDDGTHLCELIDAILADEWWGSRVSTMMKVRDLAPQFEPKLAEARRRAEARAEQDRAAAQRAAERAKPGTINPDELAAAMAEWKQRRRAKERA